MYSTCMFCNRPLGENQVIETFPVGRRMAFDAEKGRLWVVCRKCERWNLTPMEERWEAIEDCERIFRSTRIRTSTENVGLARHPEGLELVRIGRPMRPEFAAWRYGDQFGRRRRKAYIYGAAGVAVFGGIVVGGVAAGVISGALLGQSGNFVNMWVNGRTRVKLTTEDGRKLKLKMPDLQNARIVPVEEDGSWAIQLGKKKKREHFEGEQARRVAGLILPAINSTGGKPAVVQEAVRRIEEVGHPDEFLHAATREAQELRSRSVFGTGKKGKHAGLIYRLPQPTKLALEMALHEEQERRALEGELRALEIAWREAEEIAAISDDLLLPAGTEEFLARHREGADPE